jgi:ABC-type transport system involved in multi-copper enzyme maturation permease subunit
MIRRLLVIAGSVAGDALRRRLVYVVIFFAFVLSAAIPYLPTFGIGVVEGVYREIALAVMYMAALVVNVSLVATRVPSDIERRTAYAVLTKPVSRAEYLLGTWIGVFVTLLWVIAAFVVVTQVAGLISYGEANWRLWQGAFGIWAEMGALAAFGLLLSARTGTVPISLAMLAFVFVGHSRGSLLSPDDGILYSLYPSLDAFNVINQVAHGSGIGLGYAGGMLATLVGYVGLFLLLSALAFNGRDL